MTSPISDILLKSIEIPAHPNVIASPLMETHYKWARDTEQAILRVIGEDVDIERYPKESEERWAAITANVVRRNIRSKLGITGEGNNE